MASGVKTVENLSITIAANNATGTGTLTKSQTAADCVPFATCRATQNTNERWSIKIVSVTISGSTVLATSTLRMPMASSTSRRSSSSATAGSRSARAGLATPSTAVARCRRSSRSRTLSPWSLESFDFLSLDP